MERKARQSEPEDEEGVEGPTFNLFLVNMFFYLLTILIGGGIVFTGREAIILFGFSYSTFFQGLLWTPFTSMFTHSGISHIGGNMIFLFIYGYKLEERGYSPGSIYLSYLVTGLLASLLSAPIIGFTAISVGASGAVFGLLGVNAGIERRERSPNFKSVLYASIILFILSAGENTNIFAHFFGLIFGMILGNSDYFTRYKT